MLANESDDSGKHPAQAGRLLPVDTSLESSTCLLPVEGRSWISERRNRRTDAITVAGKKAFGEVASLQEGFQKDPDGTGRRVRVALGWHDNPAAEVFALVVFLCDGLLEVKNQGGLGNEDRLRFFRIARQLPMELQMLLCHRAVGSMKEVIHKWDSEAAFRDLARKSF